jgi:outer membrane protein TolC
LTRPIWMLFPSLPADLFGISHPDGHIATFRKTGKISLDGDRATADIAISISGCAPLCALQQAGGFSGGKLQISGKPCRPGPGNVVCLNGVKHMRWKHVMVGLALMVAGALGCKQQCFLQECDYEQYKKFGLPKLECDPRVSVEPASPAIPTPMTVLDVDRPVRYLSLAEAVAMALENGTTGTQSVVNAGFSNDNLVTFQGRTVAGSDSIRAFALDPAIVGADIEASLAKFDAQWNTSATWSAADTPLQGLNQFNVGQTAAINTSLLKPLPTGGVAGITFSMQYQNLSNPPRGFTVLNPSYTPTLQFQFEQPLLQGFGVEINELRATHPGSVLTPFPTGGRVEGIVITRLRFDQARAEFERDVHFMLLNVETAYWNLYGSYWDLYAQEAALRQALEAWRINKARYEAGRINIQDFAQTRQQYELFRGNRLSAFGQVLENERQLRALIGLPGEDGTRLVPADSPTLTPYQPDWGSAVNETLALRPELILARQDLKFRQLDLINTKNLMLPDLRFVSTYGLNGIGSSLDGAGTANALRSLASDQFVDWSVGFRLSYVLGYRDAHAQTRQARLNLARSYTVLRDQEEKAMRFLAQQYRHLFEFHEQIEIQRSQREAAAIQLQARFQEFLAGRGTLDILLESQRVWTAALQSEYDTIVRYNNALAGFEFAKGTIMQHDSVIISEGPLPQCAQVRATEHLRERTKALVLRERENPLLTPPCDYDKGCLGLPELPHGDAPALPAVEAGKVPLQEIHEPMPSPKPTGLPTSKLGSPGVIILPPAGKSQDVTTAPKLPSGPQSTALGDLSGASRLDAPRSLPLTLPGADKTVPNLPTFPLPDDGRAPR